MDRAARPIVIRFASIVRTRDQHDCSETSVTHSESDSVIMMSLSSRTSIMHMIDHVNDIDKPYRRA